MPATGTPEPGGLDYVQVWHLLHRVLTEREVVGLDMVELCPIPGLVAPDFLAAKLLFKMLGALFVTQGWAGARRR